ncbi:MAG: hypothetical protein ACYCW6_07965 [Candidatus Xenobia bacterium]
MIGTAAIVWILGGLLLAVCLPGHPWLTGLVVAGLGIVSVWFFKGVYGFFEGSLEGRFLANRAALVGRWRSRFAMLSRFGNDFSPPTIAVALVGGGVLGGLLSLATHSPWWLGILFGVSLGSSFVLVCKNVGGAALGAVYGLMAGIVFGPFYTVILAGGVAAQLHSTATNVESSALVGGIGVLGVVLGTAVSWPGCAALGFLLGAPAGALLNLLDESTGRDTSGSPQGALLAALLAAGLSLGFTADGLYVASMVAGTLGAWLSTRPLRPD